MDWRYGAGGHGAPVASAPAGGGSVLPAVFPDFDLLNPNKANRVYLQKALQ